MLGGRILPSRVVDKAGCALGRSLPAALAWTHSFIGSLTIPKVLNRPAAGGRRNPGMRRACSILFATLFVIGGAVSELGGGESAPPRKPRYAPVPSSEVGIASWYGHPYHGRRAANGEKYDMNRLTAAHRSLPFGTRLRVHNLRNARTVEVRITDRGPFVGGRVLDLSRAAARALGFRGGLERVRLELLSGAKTIGGDPGVRLED
jgi:hypothetical protein